MSENYIKGEPEEGRLKCPRCPDFSCNLYRQMNEHIHRKHPQSTHSNHTGEGESERNSRPSGDDDKRGSTKKQRVDGVVCSVSGCGREFDNPQLIITHRNTDHRTSKLPSLKPKPPSVRDPHRVIPNITQTPAPTYTSTPPFPPTPASLPSFETQAQNNSTNDSTLSRKKANEKAPVFLSVKAEPASPELTNTTEEVVNAPVQPETGDTSINTQQQRTIQDEREGEVPFFKSNPASAPTEPASPKRNNEQDTLLGAKSNRVYLEQGRIGLQRDGNESSAGAHRLTGSLTPSERARNKPTAPHPRAGLSEEQRESVNMHSDSAPQESKHACTVVKFGPDGTVVNGTTSEHTQADKRRLVLDLSLLQNTHEVEIIFSSHTVTTTLPNVPSPHNVFRNWRNVTGSLASKNDEQERKGEHGRGKAGNRVKRTEHEQADAEGAERGNEATHTEPEDGPIDPELPREPNGGVEREGGKKELEESITEEKAENGNVNAALQLAPARSEQQGDIVDSGLDMTVEKTEVNEVEGGAEDERTEDVSRTDIPVVETPRKTEKRAHAKANTEGKQKYKRLRLELSDLVFVSETLCCFVPSCGVKFKRRAELIQHVHSAHTKDGKMFLCPWGECEGATFVRMETFQQHVLNRHVRNLGFQTKDEPCGEEKREEYSGGNGGNGSSERPIGTGISTGTGRFLRTPKKIPPKDGNSTGRDGVPSPHTV